MHTPRQQQVLDTFAGMNREVLSMDEDLFDAGHLDSMAFIELLARLEDTCNITVSLGSLDLDAFRTVRSIAAWLDATCSSQAGTPRPAARIG